jgi:hypothetical protein
LTVEMQDFVHHKLGHRKRGETVEIQLDARANVRLLNSSQFAAYAAGRSFRAIQGQAVRSPIRWQIPQNGQWHVVIDFGGYPGGVRSSVRVLPGALPPIRSQRNPQLATLAENLAEEAPESGVDRAKAFDVFISHAGEDKAAVVRPLAAAIVDRGVSVWFDEFELRIGDSLRRKIDHGIARSRFGIVVLSSSFFAKSWPQYELDGLVTRERSGKQVILPVWHEITKDEIEDESPSLADKVALATDKHSTEVIADEVAAVILGGDVADAA